MRHYEYVGPAAIRDAARGARAGTPITTIADLDGWTRANADREPDGSIAATFTVGLDGVLRVAPRRSEHVACAAGGPVLAAGELFIAPPARIIGASNLSTGFCPEVSSWSALAAALDRAGIARPPALTTAIEFRRCPACGERNVIKDDHFSCALCDAELPRAWNF